MNEDANNNEARKATPFTSARREPDLARCRAKLAGFGDYVDCLTLNAAHCKYALSFAEGFLCQHPERHQIAARTKKDGL